MFLTRWLEGKIAMAGNVATYADIHARTRIMFSLLLSPQIQERLSEATDLVSLISLLKDTVYGTYLTQVEDKEIDPRRSVYQIKRLVADSYLSIIRTAPLQARPLLVQLYRHFELDNLKAILRGVVSGANWDQVRYVLFPLGDFTLLPAQAMVESGNVAAAVDHAADTPYYSTLSYAMQRYTVEQNLFPLEVALDLSYWRKLWEFVHKLPVQDQTQALRVIGPLVDVTNLMWAIRYRSYHHLAEEEIINYTLPFGYRVQDMDVRAIAAGADIDNVLERIYPGMENIRNLLQQPAQGLPILEVVLLRLIAGQCIGMFSGYPFQIGLQLAYLVLIEYESRDLTVLIEAKASQMPYEEFGPFLVTAQGLADRNRLLAS
jgi:V/A-type H+-transporting ATPase subunit C